MILALIIIKKSNNRALKALATMWFVNSALTTGLILWAKLTNKKENTMHIPSGGPDLDSFFHIVPITGGPDLDNFEYPDLHVQSPKAYTRLQTITNQEEI